MKSIKDHGWLEWATYKECFDYCTMTMRAQKCDRVQTDVSELGVRMHICLRVIVLLIQVQ